MRVLCHEKKLLFAIFGIFRRKGYRDITIV